MDWILSQLVGSFDLISHVVDWAAQYPGAAVFWGTIWSVMIDWAVTKSPWGWDDMLWRALKNAVAEAVRTVFRSSGVGGPGGGGGKPR